MSRVVRGVVVVVVGMATIVLQSASFEAAAGVRTHAHRQHSSAHVRSGHHLVRKSARIRRSAPRDGYIQYARPPAPPVDRTPSYCASQFGPASPEGLFRDGFNTQRVCF